jgi:hypothetical protein
VVYIDESLDAKNRTPGPQVAAVFGTPRRIESITIHWWGTPVGQTHDGILDWFCNPRSSVTTSAHYVVSEGRANCIVSPLDASWAAGNAYGNATSIHIECTPYATDGAYRTVAEVVAFLRGLYGDLPLRPHNSWTPTTCPGVWDLDRIDAIARGAGVTPATSTITPIKEDELSAEFEADARGEFDKLRGFQTDVRGALQKVTDATKGLPLLDVDLRGDLKNKGAQITALTAAVQALAAQRGTDPDIILKAVQDGVSAALGNLTASVEIKAPTNG